MKFERFEDIKAWQEARELVKLVYRAIKSNLEFRKDSLQDELKFDKISKGTHQVEALLILSVF
jgi:hypothetical protein